MIVDFSKKIWVCCALESPECALLKEHIHSLTLMTVVGQYFEDVKMQYLTSKHTAHFSHHHLHVVYPQR